MPKPRVLVASQFFPPGYRAGGPIRSLAQIIDTVPDGAEVVMVTADRDLGVDEPYPGLSGTWQVRGLAKVFYLNLADRAQRTRLMRQLGAQRWDLLYVNSLFSPRYAVLPILAARLKRIRAGRILIAPRGEFSGGALALKAAKKRYFLAVWLRLLAGMDVTWHASSEMEEADIRRAVPNARVVVCSDAVSPAPPGDAVGEPGAVPSLVFLSRIARMKNLDLVLQALKLIQVPMTLDIYGPVEDVAYWQECQELIAELPRSVTVQYRGEVTHEKVAATFAGYDAFVLPTRGENFGHVIAEALSASCPVVCSNLTPWTPVLAGGGGAVVTELTPAAVAEQVMRVAGGTVEQRRAAKVAAGAAYRTWRDASSGENIIAKVLGLPERQQ